MSAPVADPWSPADIGDQAGRTAVVTGTSLGGLGHHTALELARRGAAVVLAGRAPDKLAATDEAIRAEVPTATVHRLEVDLSSLASVRHAAAEAARLGPLDLLVNNAGVMGTPYARTADGLERQLATNHFGPFLLTGLLLPQLAAASADGADGAARVVTVSSGMHRVARQAPLGDPYAEPRRYHRWQAYAQSKLANLLFTHELDRRTREAGVPVRALAAHPGLAGTHLAANGQYGRAVGGRASILDAAVRAVSQPASRGAWPTLMAATAELPGATYCGPGGLRELAGPPQVVSCSRLARDEQAQRALWDLSERVADVRYP